MTKPKEKPLTIVQFQAENIKRLKAVTIRPDPEQPVVVLTGKNRQGKTSVLDTIWMALGGQAAIPSKPIRTGEESAFARLDLGEFVVERRITEKGAYLKVTNKEGFEPKKVQSFLDSKLGERARNPLEFMRLSPVDQVTALQGVVNLTLPVEEFLQITGLQVPAGGFKNIDPVQVLDHAHKYLYDQRSEINKEVKRLDGVCKTLASEIPDDRRDVQPVSVQELFAERRALEVKKIENDKQREALTAGEKKYDEQAKEIEQIDVDISDLQKQILQLTDNRATLETYQQNLKEDLLKLSALVEVLEDPNFSEIDARIAGADEANKIANKVQSLKASRDELDAVSTNSANLTTRLTGVKDLKGRLIAEAGLPIDGLGFENGEVTYNGLPLSQASGREQIEISCAICMAQHPAIGILTIDIGWSELDSEGREVLRKWAQQVGAQIWVTRVVDEAEGEGFHIVDGELAAVNGEPVQASGDNGEAKESEDFPIVEEKAIEPERLSWML